jgi:hypothetical protein
VPFAQACRCGDHDRTQLGAMASAGCVIKQKLNKKYAPTPVEPKVKTKTVVPRITENNI